MGLGESRDFPRLRDTVSFAGGGEGAHKRTIRHERSAVTPRWLRYRRAAWKLATIVTNEAFFSFLCYVDD